VIHKPSYVNSLMVRVPCKQQIRTLRNLIKNHVYPDKLLKQQHLLNRLIMEERHAIVIQKGRGYSIPYDPIKCDIVVNNLIDELEDKFGIDKKNLLFHCERKNDIKTGLPKGKYSGIKEYVRSKNLGIKITEGKGSPNGKCRGSNGFSVEIEKNDLINEKNSDLRKELIKLLPLYKANKIISCIKNDVENTRRPLKVINGKLYIDKNDINNISDMRIYFNDNHHAIAGALFMSTEYLSQKSTGLVTFINLGVNNDNCFRESSMKNNIITTELGICILETFGINKDGFCDIFNNYANGNIDEISTTAEKYNQTINFDSMMCSNSFKLKIQEFLDQCMGNGNMIISHNISDKDRLYRSKKVNTNVLRYKSYYGGKSKKGKRIDIEILTNSLIFTVNIRNKQGGIYPSHIMCDFKYHNDQMLL